jgi:hypothetical protein
MNIKIPSPFQDSNPPIIQPAALRYATEVPRLLGQYKLQIKICVVDIYNCPCVFFTAN